MTTVDIPTMMSTDYQLKENLIKCSHCNQSICGETVGCCLVFPHVNDSELVICMDCVDDIDSRLIPVKFKKLKKKQKTTKKNKNPLKETLIKKNRKAWK